MNLLPGMALPYGMRLLATMLAAGAAAYAGGAALSLLGEAELGKRLPQWQMAPERAAARVLTLRLLPLTAAALASLVLCLPSYLWLEPRSGHAEVVSPYCLLLALAGGLGLAWMLQRGTRAGVASFRFGRQARQRGVACEMQGQRVQVLEGPAPAMAISGVWRPVLLVSEAARANLTAEQLALGLEHEQAHRSSHDNLKRLFVAAAPLPGPRGRRLEQAWARMAEWAADDRAVRGDAQRSLTLAATLVAVARLGAGQAERCRPRETVLVSTLEHGSGKDLSERIARLLAFDRTPVAPRLRRRWIGYAIAGAVLWATLQPTTLLAAHAVLERLVH